MRVKMITRLAGPQHNAAPGSIVDVPQGLGKALLASKSAVPAAEPIQTATAPPPPETRTEPAPEADPEPDPPEPEPEPDEDAAAELPADHDPMVDELGIEEKAAELLMGEELYTLSEIEAFGNLKTIDGIGPATIATIATAISDWKAVHRAQ